MSNPSERIKPHSILGDERLRRLVGAALPGAHIVAVEALDPDAAPEGGTAKGAGYGAPLRIDIQEADVRRSVVLHTATENRFGHERRSDRAAECILAADTFGTVKRHVKVIDAGAFRGDDSFVSLGGTGEFYLLTEWGEGEPYAQSLRRLVRTAVLEAGDRERVDSLAAYLAGLHAERCTTPFARERALRDLFGSGEGIFGIIDGYPEAAPGLTAGRLRRIEERCLDWRWRLKRMDRPLVRTHGDFHPFNILFDAKDKLVLLDTSRGSLGEAADDVACLAINYPFFALDRPDAWQGCFSELWFRLWDRYLELSSDPGVLDAVAPFFAWRGLVLASPIWYPHLAASAREKLLDFVEAVLEAPRFSPALAEGIFA